MAVSDLLNDTFEWSDLANWTPVYNSVENRNWVQGANESSAPSNPGAVGTPATFDLREQVEGYDLQKLRSFSGPVGETLYSNWIKELQEAVGQYNGAFGGSFTTDQSLQFGSGSWLDTDNPISGGHFLGLNATSKLGLGGLWRRRRPREIAATNATEDRFGNAAAAGQRAYLYAGSLLGPSISGGLEMYRCVASGNWVRDDDGRPDVIDSASAAPNNLPWGECEPGDYIGFHIFWEIARRIQLAVVCTVDIGFGDNSIEGRCFSKDPTTGFWAPDETTAASEAATWTVTTPTITPSSSHITGRQWYGSHDRVTETRGTGSTLDDYDAIRIEGFKQILDVSFCYGGPASGTMHVVLLPEKSQMETLIAAGTWVFDAQGSGMTMSTVAEYGSEAFAPGDRDGSGRVIIDLPTSGVDAPATIPAQSGGFAVVKHGVQFSEMAYVVWTFPDD